MYTAALLLGFTGSIHCIGMCSPLVMAVTNITAKAWLNRFLYNGGRIVSYGFMGLAASSAERLVPIANYQNTISLVLGMVLLVMAVAGFSSMPIPFFTAALAKFISYLKRIFSRYLQKRTSGSIIVLGMINGLLPCGLSFVALAFCLTLRGPWQGFTFMLVFGAGTLPAMLGLTALLNTLIQKFKWGMHHVMTTLLLIAACLLIARGVVHHNPGQQHKVSNSETPIVVCR